MRLTILALLSVITYALTPLSAFAEPAYLVQLGSFDTREAAQKVWAEYAEDYSAQLNDVEQRISEIELPGKTIYRLQAGPISGRTGAKNLCNALKPKLESCLLVETAMLEAQRDEAILPAGTAASLGNELEVAGESTANNIEQMPSLLGMASSAADSASSAAEDAAESVASDLQETVSPPAVELSAPKLSSDDIQMAMREGAQNALDDKADDALDTAAKAVNDAQEEIVDAAKAVPVPEVDATPLPTPSSINLSDAAQFETPSALAESGEAVADAKEVVESTTQNLADSVDNAVDDLGHVDVKEAIRVDPSEMPVSSKGNLLDGSEVELAAEEASSSPLTLPNAVIQKQPGVIEAARKRKQSVDQKQIADGIVYWVKMLPFSSQTVAFNYWELFKAKRDVFRALTMSVLAPYKVAGKRVPYTVKAGALDVKEDAIELCLLAKEEGKDCRVVEVNDTTIAAVASQATVNKLQGNLAAQATANKGPRFAAAEASNIRHNGSAATPQSAPAPTSEGTTKPLVLDANSPLLERAPEEPFGDIAASGSFWVQLGSFSTVERAKMAWNEVVDAHAELFEGLRPRITTPQTSAANTNTFRLRTGAFATRLDAMNFCTKAQKNGLKCLVIAEY